MRQQILDAVRRIVGTNRLQQDLTELRRTVGALLPDQAAVTQVTADPSTRVEAATNVVATHLTILPGTPYSQFALPLEYPPSRDMQPRWGNTRPLLQPLVDWISPHAEAYCKWLTAIRRNGPAMSKIAYQFDPVNLPEPAWCGVPYCAFDAAALYTIIGEARPKLYLEIGSGVTTAFAYRSIRDHGLSTKIVSIDPEPRAAIDSICDEVVRAGLETCDLAVFDRLEPGDILFFDGSHRSYMNSDVTVFMLEILPRLKPGVIIHIHDIALPWDYPEWAVPWYWNEQYILAAYIIGAAARLKPILPTAWVCKDAAFQDWFKTPPVDLGAENGGWQGGGAMWFTHTS
jgi:hypothetical protein